MNAPCRGKVHVVGAGPGDPDLMTVKGRRVLEQAEVVVYDRDVAPEILNILPRTIARFDVDAAARPHEAEAAGLMVSLALQGLRVVRLKADVSLMESDLEAEIVALRTAGIPHEVVPGLIAAQAIAASAAVPLAPGEIGGGVRFLRDPLDELPERADWKAMADRRTTLVCQMEATRLGTVAERLMRNGMPAAVPVLVVSEPTTPRESSIRSRLCHLRSILATLAPEGQLVCVVGDVVARHRWQENSRQRAIFA
ncbi:uroporphyrinogen-III C-methyltransferase [Salipiger mucosus]|uniref:uroporphyrinogen-III C-methyltransferase n=1 Tax=Salipiger mucosus DSM 16094 TaxID=1123237 RepID=S9SA98_9RHOB|nr:uroporphyrinogen-III C-methyltransferase [Salipiger mucosus]EPX87070.1 hypothetical protein Salmuc_00023 [Salipiger mucosus DSM 16094]